MSISIWIELDHTGQNMKKCGWMDLQNKLHRYSARVRAAVHDHAPVDNRWKPQLILYPRSLDGKKLKEKVWGDEHEGVERFRTPQGPSVFFSSVDLKKS